MGKYTWVLQYPKSSMILVSFVLCQILVLKLISKVNCRYKTWDSRLLLVGYSL